MKHEIVPDKHVTVPAIVTAADYSHFKEAMNMISNMNQGIRKVYPDMKLIFYDLGLSGYQREQVLDWSHFVSHDTNKGTSNIYVFNVQVVYIKEFSEL